MARSMSCAVLLLCLVTYSTAALSRLHVEVVGVQRNTAYGKSTVPGNANFQPAIPNNRQIEPGASGFVVSDHEDILCGYDLNDDCQFDYPENAEVVLVATPFPGSRFAGWEYDTEAAIAGEVYMTPARVSNAFFAADGANRRILTAPPTDRAPEGPVEARFRVSGVMIRVRAIFVLNELPTLRCCGATAREPVTLPVGVLSIQYDGTNNLVTKQNWTPNPVVGPDSIFADPSNDARPVLSPSGIPLINGGAEPSGKFTVSFHGNQLDDEVDVIVRDVVWICDDDGTRASFTLVQQSLTGNGVTAQKRWTVQPPRALPPYGVCQVNITAFTNVTTNNFIPDTYTFSHKVLVWGGGNNAAAASHVQRGDYAVTSSWDYFSDFVSTIPAGVNIPTGKTARRRFRVKEAPPAGKYIMDVNIQIKGTTVGTDLVTCTAGIVPIGADTITQPRIIDYRTRAVSDFADGSARFLRDDMDSWFPAGSVKVQHLRRIYELGNNQTPPEIMVVCKNLNTPTKKRSLDAAMETEQSVGRSVAVGPIIVSFYRADTPWVLDSVVMNYRFGNIVTKTPN